MHEQTKRRLLGVGLDFSGFVEMTCLSFLSATSDIFKRVEAVKAGGPEVSPGELRVLMLQALGSVYVKTGAEFAKVMGELDTIQAVLDAQPKLLPVEPIHTPEKKKTVRKPAKK